jgi:hypothetical protein
MPHGVVLSDRPSCSFEGKWPTPHRVVPLKGKVQAERATGVCACGRRGLRPAAGDRAEDDTVAQAADGLTG